jgi:hypothetical protein
MPLDDEEADGYIVVVTGFYCHIKDWHARRLGCGEAPAGFTTNFRRDLREVYVGG